LKKPSVEAENLKLRQALWDFRHQATMVRPFFVSSWEIFKIAFIPSPESPVVFSNPSKQVYL